MTTAQTSLAGIAHDLYGLALSEFTAARNARAARAKAEGDTELADRVAALRKPTVAAWVVNMLTRHRPERIGELIGVGDQMLRAHEENDTDSLRTLTRQRRALTEQVAQEGVELAAERGQKVSAAAADQVRTTLQAIMTSPGAEGAARSGVLIAPIEASGFADSPIEHAVALPLDVMSGRRQQVSPAVNGPTDLAARRAAQQAKLAKEVADATAYVTGCEATVSRAEVSLKQKREQLSGVQAQVLQVRAELEELLRQVEETEARLEPLVQELEHTQDGLRHAEADVIKAQAELERASLRLARAKKAR